MKNPKKSRPSNAAIIKEAKRLYDDEGTLEIDDNAKISIADGESDGAYVQAWVWVYFEDMEGSKNGE